MDEKKDIFSAKIDAGRRTYFIDVKESTKKEKYIVITERISKQNEYKTKGKKMVFKENIPAFQKALEKAFQYFSE